MNAKYSNIFWHQGIKIFEENLLKTEKGRLKISHLENDVTKSLLNIFQHCDKKTLQSFFKLIGVKDAAESFEFDFQVTNTSKYRIAKNRIMLSIVSSSTPIKSDSSYVVDYSIPDACIFNNNTAILVESKTQSPLLTEQLENHVRQYLGSATNKKLITWEEISEKFKFIANSLSSFDKFLVYQFCDFLELIGLAAFSGFKASDFAMMGSIGQITTEDFLDFKRFFHKKIEKFMHLIDENVQQYLSFKNYDKKIMKITAKDPGGWSAFYFYDDDPNIHVNKYPNINFSYQEYGIELSINSEIQDSVNKVLSIIKKDSPKFNDLANKIKDFYISIYYKMQFLPMNNFVWKLIPGYPIKMSNIQGEDVVSEIENFENYWPKFRDTLLFEMKSGIEKHRSNRFFTKNELTFATENNKQKPNYVIRINKQYSVKQIDELKKNVIFFFTQEIRKIVNLVQLINS